MKKIIFISIILFSIRSVAQSNDELSVRKVLNEQTEAWNNGNIDAFMKGYWESDSLMFVGKSGVTFGWGNTLNNYKRITRIHPQWGNLILPLFPLSVFHFNIFSL